MAATCGLGRNSGGNGGSLPFPRATFFILIGYGLERLVYNGLFSAAVFYMQRMLGFTASSAATTKAVMEGIIYIVPIPGAFIADAYVGKVRLVFLMCCGYLVGAVIYTLSSVTPLMTSVTVARVTGVSGLLALGICTGLMKAVYISLGADQFKLPEQKDQQKSYFNLFYWMICGGATLGHFMTAQLRDTVQCFGDDCYFLPFAILLVLMVISTAIFALGRSRYVESPPDDTLIQAVRCIWHAVCMSCDKDRKPVDHWLDRVHSKYDAQLILDVKAMLRILVLFCTFPVFWALFYQTSTGMIFQGKRLNNLVGSYRIPPEMSPLLGTFLTLIFIPIFELIVYPLCKRCNLLTKTTSRIAVGMVFSVASFIMYALVNMSVEQTILTGTEARVHLYNTLPCNVSVSLPQAQVDRINVVGSGGQLALPSFTIMDDPEIVELRVRSPPSCGVTDVGQVRAVVLGGHETTVLITSSGAVVLSPTLEYIKDEDAETKVRVLDVGRNITNVTLKYDTLEEEFQLSDSESSFKRLSPKEYKVMLGDVEVGDAFVYQDGVYDVVIDGTQLFVFPVTAPADVHMIWLLPQYLGITFGEILCSVSSIELAHTHAPPSMKSTMQAANLFTITVGLWLFAGLTSLSAAMGTFRHRASHEAFFYAGLMAANTIVFVMLLRWYNTGPQPQDHKGDPRERTTAESDAGKSGMSSHENPGYVEDHAL